MLRLTLHFTVANVPYQWHTHTHTHNNATMAKWWQWNMKWSWIWSLIGCFLIKNCVHAKGTLKHTLTQRIGGVCHIYCWLYYLRMHRDFDFHPIWYANVLNPFEHNYVWINSQEQCVCVHLMIWIFDFTFQFNTFNQYTFSFCLCWNNTQNHNMNNIVILHFILKCENRDKKIHSHPVPKFCTFDCINKKTVVFSWTIFYEIKVYKLKVLFIDVIFSNAFILL